MIPPIPYSCDSITSNVKVVKLTKLKFNQFKLKWYKFCHFAKHSGYEHLQYINAWGVVVPYSTGQEEAEKNGVGVLSIYII